SPGQCRLEVRSRHGGNLATIRWQQYDIRHYADYEAELDPPSSRSSQSEFGSSRTIVQHSGEIPQCPTRSLGQHQTYASDGEKGGRRIDDLCRGGETTSLPSHQQCEEQTRP